MGALSLLACATLGFQVLQVVVLSLQLFPEAAFLVVSLSMLGLGSGGSLATALVRRRTFVSPLGPLWGCAIGFSLAVLGAMVATSRMHGLLALIVVNTLPWPRAVVVEEPDLRGGGAPVGMLEQFFPANVPWGGALPHVQTRRVRV